jgi:MFS family permease
LSAAAPGARLLARFNPWRGLAGLPGRLWLLFAATLINRAGTMVLPFLAIYLTRARGFSTTGAGAMLGLYGVAAIATSPVAGRLADRFGPLPVMVGGLAAAGAVLLAYPLAQSAAAIALATLAFACGNEMYRPASLTAVGSWLPPEQLRMGFVLSRLAVNLGMSVGPAVGGLLAARSFRGLFVVDALTTLAAAGLILAAIPRLRRAAPGAASPHLSAAEGVQPPEELAAGDLVGAEPGAPQAPQLAGAGVLADRAFLSFLAAVTLVLIVFFQHASTMPLFMVRTLGLSPAAYGLMFTLSTLQIVFLEVPLNGAMAGWPLRRSLALGGLLCGLGFGGLSLAHGVRGVTAAVVTFTFGEMILFPSSSAYASRRAPAARRGAYMGAYSMSAAIAFAVGPWLGTAVLARWGPAALWAACFAVSALGALMLARVEEERPST